MNQKLKRLGLLGIAVVIAAMHLSIPALRVFAEPITTPDSTFEKEYKHWKAALLLSNCTDNDFDSSDDEIGTLGGKDGYTWGSGDIGASKVFGKLANISLSSNEIDCSSVSVKNALGKAAGFNDLRGIEDLWFPPLDKDGNSRRRDDHTPLDSALKDAIDNNGGGRDGVRKALFEFTVKNHPGPDGKTQLSPGATYWYWKNTVASDCFGSFSDDYEKYTGVDSTSFRQPNDVKDKDSPGGEYNTVDENGAKKTFRYAIFDGAGIPDDFDDTDNLETLDSDIVDNRYTTGNTDVKVAGQPPDCVDVVNLFKGDKLSVGVTQYLDKYNQLVKDCTDTGKTEEECKTGIKTNPAVDVTKPSEADSNQEIEFQCSLSFNPISWFMCPLIQGFTEAINQLDKQINSMLDIDTEVLFGSGTTTGDSFKNVWSSMRALAISFLVIIGLVMVISTAIGVGVFDAYTVKKIFPRLVISVVVISVSWPLVIFLIEASNLLGLGIRSLIQSPFAGELGVAKVDGTQLSLGSLGAVGLGLALGPVGLLSLVAGAFVAVGIAFFTLILRELLIVLLAVSAPVAIAAYILPNTQKAGKLWWDFFSKALLAFPIISAFIAIGRVFAVVAQGSDDSSGTVRGFIGFIAYFAPYFMLPKAFAMAGGALGNLSGMVNDRGKGAFDRLRKVRQNKAQDNFKRMREGNYLRGESENDRGEWRKKVNRSFEAASSLNKAGFDPRRMRTKLQNAMADSSEGHIEDALKHSNFGIWSGDDEKVWAAKENSVEEVAAKLLERDPGRFSDEKTRMRAAEQIMADKRAMGAETFARARIRAQAKTGTGYIDKTTGKFDAALMMKDINDAYGDDRNGAGKALAEMRSSLANSGQVAGLAGYGTWAASMEDMYRAEGTGTEADAATKAHKEVMADTINSVAPGQALYGKPSSAAAIGEAHADRISEIAKAVETGGLISEWDPNTGKVAMDPATGKPVMRKASKEDLSAAVANAAGIYDAMAQASPNNANAMAKELMGVRIGRQQKMHDVVKRGKDGGWTKVRQPMVDANNQPIYDDGPSVREYITSQMDSNPAFVDRRRDFSQATYLQGQQAQAAQMAAQHMNPTQGGVGGGPAARPF